MTLTKHPYIEYIVPFLIGGSIVSGVKYVSTIATPAQAAIIGCFPIGFISSYFIEPKKKKEYLINYCKTIFSVVTGVIISILLLDTSLHYNITLIIGVVLIFIFSYLRIKYFN